MYLDSAYVAKYYLNEPDSPKVRAAIAHATSLVTSAWSVLEVMCAFHRHHRAGSLSPPQFRETVKVFRKHREAGVWTLIPITEAILSQAETKVAALPADVFLRAGDAVQLASAAASGESEIWGSDRHLLAAAPHFGLAARTV